MRQSSGKPLRFKQYKALSWHRIAFIRRYLIIKMKIQSLSVLLIVINFTVELVVGSR